MNAFSSRESRRNDYMISNVGGLQVALCVPYLDSKKVQGLFLTLTLIIFLIDKNFLLFLLAFLKTEC